jgi:serine/threonine protein kinase
MMGSREPLRGGPAAMPDLDAQTLADHAVMLGLITRAQARAAENDAEDGSLGAMVSVLLRKGLLTSWQLDRIQKDDPSGFFYGVYKVLFHLAEGTFARVYRGVRQDSGSPVAVKVLRNRYVADVTAIERFNKEAESGMRLRHPNIVQILDYGEQDRRQYIVMEYVEGSNLRDFLKLRVRLKGDEALPMMIGLARGLKYSHDQGVTHRDIKGTNVLISNKGEAKLVDFGLATLETDEKRTTMLSQRTVDYSALERSCGSEKGDPRSDVYFLGCVFYQMLTGQVAMKETESDDMLQKMLKRSFGAIVPLSEHRHAPDPELADIVEKMMRVNLKSRYQSVDHVLKDLEGYQERVKHGVLGIEHVEEDEMSEFLSDLESFFASDADSSAAASAAGAAPAGVGGAGTTPVAQPTVLCVDTQEEVRNAFRKRLTKMGYRPVLFGDAGHAAERFREAPTDALIFDTDGFEPEALRSLIDIHAQARQAGRPFLALILLGKRQLGWRPHLPTGDRVVVLEKPVRIKQVLDMIAKLLPLG